MINCFGRNPMRGAKFIRSSVDPYQGGQNDPLWFSVSIPGTHQASFGKFFIMVDQEDKIEIYFKIFKKKIHQILRGKSIRLGIFYKSYSIFTCLKVKFFFV